MGGLQKDRKIHSWVSYNEGRPYVEVVEFNATIHNVKLRRSGIGDRSKKRTLR